MEYASAYIAARSGEGHIATLMARGADQVRYKGLEGALIQMGMTVMAHNGAVLVRVAQQRLSKREQKFRRLLGLKRHNVHQINDQKRARILNWTRILGSITIGTKES
jgi:hypothetical protein